MELQKVLAFWKKSAALDKKTSEDLFKSKNYVGCLFFVHLYLEKILKGLVQKSTQKMPPFNSRPSDFIENWGIGIDGRTKKSSDDNQYIQYSGALFGLQTFFL